MGLLVPLLLWPWTGEVVGIMDGDTITVLKAKTPIKSGLTASNVRRAARPSAERPNNGYF
jgi:hypothetical protein